MYLIYYDKEPNHLLLFYYTGPEKPVDIKITAKGTHSVKISWTLPAGTVDNYVVTISNERHTLYNTTAAFTTAFFTDLYPGRIFFITVTAVAGNFSEMSDQFSFATGKFNNLCCY